MSNHIVILVEDIIMPPAGSSGYASASVAEDETEPDWVDVEVYVDAFAKPDTTAREAAASQFSTEDWVLTSHDVVQGDHVLTYRTNAQEA